MKNQKSKLDLPLAYNSGNIRSINETRASISIGAPIGITVNTQDSIIELAMDYASDGGEVFVDSGAFSEFRVGTNLDIETDSGLEFWKRVISIYNRIADESGDGVYNIAFVAPDQIGSQSTSLKNLDWLRYEVNALIEKGCKIIQPIQAGEHNIAANIANLSEFYNDFEKVILGFPSKAAAWKVSDVIGYLEQLAAYEKKAAANHNDNLDPWLVEYYRQNGDDLRIEEHRELKVHLLGKGDPVALVKVQEKIAAVRPGVILSGDSVATGGVVGKGRKLTVRMNKILELQPELTKPERGALRGQILADIETDKRAAAAELYNEYRRAA